MTEKKRCAMCGAYMESDYDGDICDCCLEDMRDDEPDEPTVFIYDIEVFSDDWLAIFRRVDSDAYTVIHNDNHKLRAFLDQPNIIIGGFNNKHYDDYIVLTMYLGGSNYDVKKHNDHIIGGSDPWTFPFIQFQKKPFKSFDLRDDIPDKGLSLKAIEGNLNLPIVESSVPFDIDRPLTTEELDEVIRYCKYDVESTLKLYHERKEDYLDAKAMVGDMYGVPYQDAVGMTNAKLSALVLEAKYEERNDERDYVVPDNINQDLIPKVVLDFFLQINDKSIPDAKLFGAGKGQKGLTLKAIIKTSAGECPVTYAWGGVHGAKPCVTIEEDENRVIINQDVASLYPNSMINFGYCSRGMKDPDAYKKLVEKRLGYKKAGDKVRASALKLVVNTVYGAMLNQYNDLADRLAGRSVCISNQLAITMLIVQLGRACKTIDFVNINTDGIMFTIDRSEIELSEQIVQAWSEITRFEMERDDFKKVIQKDVNNYIGITPEGKLKTKGGYVSLYKGGNYRTNSLSIIHKAVVDNLVNGVDPEKTINDCEDIFAFQQIVKTGGSYEGTFHHVGDQLEQVQKVNRVYAVKDPKYGQIVKGKWITEKRKKDKASGKMISEPVDPPVWQESTIPECPDHAFIDNENVLTIGDLDKSYYVEMAKNRIDKYINLDPKVGRELKKIEEVISIMATKTEVQPTNKNVYQKLLEARYAFLEQPIEKSGKNVYAGFKYFELEDIVPVANNIFTTLGLLLIENITFEKVSATVVNVDDPSDQIVFEAPAKDCAIEDGTKMSAIQGLGAYITYMRRYLYTVVLDIVDADSVNATIAKPDADEKVVSIKKNNRPATPEQREEVKKELIDEDGNATDVQVKSIKAGLKKLRAKNDSYEDYVTEIVGKLKSGMKKADAEDVLIEIGKKIEE